MKTQVIHVTMRHLAFGVLTGLLLSCASSYWLDDARTLDRGNWRVDGQIMRQMAIQDNSGDALSKYIWYLPNGTLQLSYGLTNRMDVGVIVNQFTLTGVSWKYRLTRSNTGHILSVGGRTALKSLLDYDEVSIYDGLRISSAVDGHLWYTRAFSRTAYTIQPSIGMYFLNGQTEEEHKIIRHSYKIGYASMGFSLTSALDENVDFRVGLQHSYLFDLEDKTRSFYTFNITWGVSYYIR